MFAETKCPKCKKIILGVEMKEGVAGVCKSWWHGTFCFLGTRLTKRSPDFGYSRPNDCEINPEDLSGKNADDTPAQSG